MFPKLSTVLFSRFIIIICVCCNLFVVVVVVAACCLRLIYGLKHRLITVGLKLLVRE